MRKAFIIAAIILQVIVLAYMAGEREYISKFGKVIHLRTAPIDPRDLFRGDYVRLNYEISRLAVRNIIDVKNLNDIKKGDKLYVSLQEGINGLYALETAQLQKPEESLYLTGRIPMGQGNLRPRHPININYGIEAYFVEQGKGRDIEKRRGNRRGVQVPLEMAIAVGGNGKAVIKGHRWSPLGIGLHRLRRPPRNSQEQEAPASATVRLTLVNASDKPLAIVDLPDYCSFSLEPVLWAEQQWASVHNQCEAVLPTDSDIVILKPQQKKSVEFDFTDDRWLVTANGIISQIGTLVGSEQFRIVYRPPDKGNCLHLEQSDLIWHGYLASGVFHGRGQID
jgi:uncharacterized membrane-anchored protein